MLYLSYVIRERSSTALDSRSCFNALSLGARLWNFLLLLNDVRREEDVKVQSKGCVFYRKLQKAERDETVGWRG
jgi:hypothetical protein